ncbi:hypothetical protein M9H77_03170 [Catharanthus roseus]|uniref:Uncharacterized protein n=1 Tax=Catharanthus roseus TaxID=4058 RepID=A0ACC0CAR3_CATRO|nr:hypothetical protein M9H77_03170 [Catharanthus roseus]
MKEVPAHMYSGPIVPDVLTRQHEHRSGLIWSGDHETCITDLHCRRFGRNLFQSYSTAPRRLVKKEPLEAWILREFTGLETDDDLILRAPLGGARQVGGALVLLQIWAWSRSPVLRPQILRHVQPDPLAPLGAIWCTFLGLMPPTQSHPPTSYTPLPLGFSSFQAPHPPSTGSSSFQALPPSGTVGSSTPHMPILTASSSDIDEHDDE